MVNGTADDYPEFRYRQKQIEFRKRWYQAHVRRADADLGPVRLQRSEGQRGSHVDGPEPSAYKFLEFVTGQRIPASPDEREAGLAELVAEIDEDASRFERVANWWEDKRPVFLDPVLVDRCAYSYHNPDQVSREVRLSNTDAMVAIAKYLGQALVDDLSREANRPLLATGPPLYWIRKTKLPRPDLWAGWGVKGLRGLGLRLWVNHRGAALGGLSGPCWQGMDSRCCKCCRCRRGEWSPLDVRTTRGPGARRGRRVQRW